MTDITSPSTSADKPVRSEVLPSVNTSYPTKESIGSHLSDLSLRDSLEILCEGANLIPGLGALLKTVLGAGDYNPEKRLQAAQFKWLIEQCPKIMNKLDILVARLPQEKQPEPADVAAIMEAALAVSRKTVGSEKRQLLKNALVNAFDPEQYQQGLALRFFRILEDVEYGDVVTLRNTKLIDDAMRRAGANSPSSSLVKKYLPGRLEDFSLTNHHIEILESLNLISTPELFNEFPCITELGMKFLDFIQGETPSSNNEG